MPVRIYDISKKLGLEVKEIIAKAKQMAALAVLDHLVLEGGTSEEIVSTFSNAGPKAIIAQSQVASGSTQLRAGIS